MLFNFKKAIQICFKPADSKKFKFNRVSFQKGVNDVPDEVLAHKYFKNLVGTGIVEEVGKKSFDVSPQASVKKMGAKSAKALKQAATASVPEGFEVQDIDAIVAGITK